jgi:hypothetical protein
MNDYERGSCIAYRSSAELRKSISRHVRQKGERPFPSESRDAYTEKITHIFSQSAHIQGLHFETQSCFTSLAGAGMFRLLTCVLFNLGGSLIDEGVNFRPAG